MCYICVHNDDDDDDDDDNDDDEVPSSFLLSLKNNRDSIGHGNVPPPALPLDFEDGHDYDSETVYSLGTDMDTEAEVVSFM